MKNLILFICFFVSVSASAQVKMFGNGGWNINGKTMYWINGSGDTLITIRTDTLKVNIPAVLKDVFADTILAARLKLGPTDYQLLDTVLGWDPVTQSLKKTIAFGDLPFGGQPKFRILAGIIRPTIPESTGQPIVWEWLGSSTQHDTLFFSGVIEATSSNSLKLYYRTMKNVITFLPKMDDAYAAGGIQAGASVATDNAELFMFYPSHLGTTGYIQGNGSGWDKSTNLNELTIDYSSGFLRFNTSSSVKAGAPDGSIALYVGANGYKLKRVLSGLGIYNVGYQIVDEFGNNASITPQSSDIIQITYPGSRYRALQTQLRNAVTDEYTTFNSAIFVIGIMEELDDPLILTGEFTAEADGSSTIDLEWPEVQGVGAGNYIVQRSTTKNFHTVTTVYTGIGTTYSDTGLASATTYYYRVRFKRTSDDAYSDYLLTQETTE